MKIKTMELTGAALDWAVAKCEGLFCFGYRSDGERFAVENNDGGVEGFMPSTNWAQGGPIIERWVSDLSQRGEWYAQIQINDVPEYAQATGPTPLVAAMRCYVASQLGDEVEIPDELKGESK